MTSLRKVFRDGAWWAERPDGSWVRWNDAAQAWEPAPVPAAFDAPPPPAPAEDDTTSVDARVAQSDMVYLAYGDEASITRDALRVYGFLAGAAFLVLFVIAFALRVDPGMIFTAPRPRDLIAGTLHEAPNPYVYMGLALALFGLGILAIKRRGSVDWWPVQLTVLGLGMAVAMSVVATAVGFHDGFDAMRFVYYWTVFLAMGWAFMQFRAWRGW